MPQSNLLTASELPCVYMGLCQFKHDYIKLAALILCNNEEYFKTF